MSGEVGLATLTEDRSAPGAVVRHRGATIDRPEAATPTLTLVRGALWARGDGTGPGVLITHGASTVLIRDGAAVVESIDFEAIVLVVSGEIAVKGANTLPRSVFAGHAITLSLDGTFGSPEPLSAAELAADRFVTENLARDALLAAPPAPLSREGDGSAAPESSPAAVAVTADAAPDRTSAEPPASEAPSGPADAAERPAGPERPSPDEPPAPRAGRPRLDSPPPALPAAPPAARSTDPEPTVELPIPGQARAGRDGQADPAEPVVREPGAAEIVVRDPFAPDHDPAPVTVDELAASPTVEAEPHADDAPPSVITPADVPAAEPSDDDAPPAPRSRRRLLVVLIGLALVAAVVAALLLAGDEPGAAPAPTTPLAAGGGAPSSDRATTTAEAEDEPETPSPDRDAPVAELDGCEATAEGFAATGTVAGGGQTLARYVVVIGLVDADGELYAEKPQRVVPADDRTEAVEWTVTVEIDPADLRPGTDCELMRVEALRI